MTEAFLCEGARTPVGRYGGSLSSVRPDDLLAHAIKATLAKAPGLDPHAIDDVFAQKIDALDAHASQFYEWLPWIDGKEVPRDHRR